MTNLARFPTNGERRPRADIGLALFAHTGFGLFVVFVKYLLNYLPPFRMLAVAFTIALPLVLMITNRAINWRELRRREIWLLAAIMMARSLTKLLGLQFTYALYVQLVDMAVPLLAPILAWLLLREAMPVGTVLAILITTIGSFLVITVDPFHMSLPNGHRDLIGIGFAFASAVLMTLGMVYTRGLTAHRHGLSPQGLFLAQVFVGAGTYWVLSIVSHESWMEFAHLPSSVMIAFTLLILVSIVAAGISQIVSLARVKTSLFSTLLSWRLVIAASSSWILLGEKLSTAWQIAGILLVIGSITLYLRRQWMTEPMGATRVLA